jgi:uncharacterized lipoprotein YajG
MKMKIMLILASLLCLSACHTIRETDFVNFQYEKLPLKAKATKEGKSCGEYSLFSIFYTNVDMTIEAAKKNGDITEIISVEKEHHITGLFYRKVCTIVKGN